MVPSFRTTFLNTIAAAIARRSKSLKYHAAHFACSRVVTAEGEVLHVDMDTFEPRSTRLRLMIWDDGHVWLGVHQPNPSAVGGWAFALVRSGNLLRVAPDDVVRMIEGPGSAVHGATRSPDAPNEVERIWEPARLERER